jgi:hypothetical protein
MRCGKTVRLSIQALRLLQLPEIQTASTYRSEGNPISKEGEREMILTKDERKQVYQDWLNSETLTDEDGLIQLAETAQ